MAAKPYSKEYTFTNTAAVNLPTIMGLSNSFFISNFAVRAGKSNVGDVGIGDATVTTTSNRGGYLEPRDAVALDLFAKFMKADDIYFVGTTNDKIHILGVE
jgi:hypothetical protein